MKKIKLVAGITWAFACLIILIILFPALNPLSVATSKLPFMKVNPNYSGGEVVKEIKKESYSVGVRRPVFDGLVGEKSRGFVQVDWRGNLPDTFIDTIDFNMDGASDFVVKVKKSSAEATLTSLNQNVENITVSTPTSYGWAVRVGLKK